MHPATRQIASACQCRGSKSPKWISAVFTMGAYISQMECDIEFAVSGRSGWSCRARSERRCRPVFGSGAQPRRAGFSARRNRLPF